MAIWKKNPLEEYDNKLGKIQQEKLQIKKRLEELEILETNTLENRKDAGLRMYMKVEKREKLFLEAEELGYSHEIIENLRNQTEDWNQDNITNEVLDEIENLNVYIKKTSSTQKKPIVFIEGYN